MIYAKSVARGMPLVVRHFVIGGAPPARRAVAVDR